MTMKKLLARAVRPAMLLYVTGVASVAASVFATAGLDAVDALLMAGLIVFSVWALADFAVDVVVGLAVCVVELGVGVLLGVVFVGVGVVVAGGVTTAGVVNEYVPPVVVPFQTLFPPLARIELGLKVTALEPEPTKALKAIVAIFVEPLTGVMV